MSTTHPHPPPVCPTCWNVFRAAKPQPAGIYCHHRRVAVRLMPDTTWRVLADVDRAEGADLCRHWLQAAHL